VHVGLGVGRDVVVDDVADPLDVEAAGGHVGPDRPGLFPPLQCRCGEFSPPHTPCQLLHEWPRTRWRYLRVMDWRDLRALRQ
jgi:hypothetical protein